jgi:hypothetical protein
VDQLPPSFFYQFEDPFDSEAQKEPSYWDGGSAPYEDFSSGVPFNGEKKCIDI